ncbi:MAG: GNAT family N-acetyltransferase [Burkholderiales bacterium]|nr:GNAT family N-acetyltransferase [Burkholderiales bacterium]
MNEAVSLRGPRVLLRPWTDADLEPFAAMNADAEVMRWFRAPLTREESDAMVGRIRTHFAADGHGLWALQTPELAFAGFVGLFPVLGFALPFEGYADPPPREIGWRLPKAAWGRGFASEAAALALAFARDTVRLPRVVSFTTLGNVKSQAVMRRIGLRCVGEFDHPNLPGHALQRHVLYATAPDWAAAGPGASP